jgi:Rrf2 family protein
VWLGSNPDRTFSTLQISQATHTPAGYLSKVLQELARAGLVVSQTGRTGGFTLTRPPQRISVLDVINAVDPIERIDRCPLDLASHVELCPLHRRLDNALGMVERAFAESTIGELVAEPARSKPLCDRSRRPPKGA